MRVVQHDAGATRSNDLARRCDEMTTAFRFANASGQVHHGVFSKGGQSKSLALCQHLATKQYLIKTVPSQHSAHKLSLKKSSPQSAQDEARSPGLAEKRN